MSAGLHRRHLEYQVPCQPISKCEEKRILCVPLRDQSGSPVILVVGGVRPPKSGNDLPTKSVIDEAEPGDHYVMIRSVVRRFVRFFIRGTSLRPQSIAERLILGEAVVNQPAP